VVNVSAGIWHSLAIRSDGTVWAWGRDDDAELGDGQIVRSRITPQPVPNVTGVRQVVAEEGDSFALRTDGSVLAWGSTAAASSVRASQVARKARPSSATRSRRHPWRSPVSPN
jgi:alpha-tubulin suppressor-like RCC1 family protein